MISLLSKSSGDKYDSGKLRYDLIPAYPIEQLAAVFTFGAKKYDDWNWTKGIVFSRLIGSLFRHLWAFVRGIDNDHESGLPHLAHVMWNAAALLYFTEYRKDLDDRKKNVPDESPQLQSYASCGISTDYILPSKLVLSSTQSDAYYRLWNEVQSGTSHGSSQGTSVWHESQADQSPQSQISDSYNK